MWFYLNVHKGCMMHKNNNKYFRYTSLHNAIIALSLFTLNNSPAFADSSLMLPETGITVGAVFLQPAASNLDYAVLGFPLPAQSPHWNVAILKPGLTTGFDLGGRYHLKQSDNDVRINWTHVSTQDSASTIAGENEYVMPLFQAGPSAGLSFDNPSQQARATAQFNYDIINADAGQFVNYGQRTQLRFSAGVTGGQLKETLNRSFQDDAATYLLSIENTSKFIGAGPLFTLNGLYQLPYHIGLIGSLNASALIGQLQSSTNYSASSTQLKLDNVAVNYQNISPDNTTQVVPGLDGKLGLNIVHSFGKGTICSVDVGYEYATYFNAIAAYNPTGVDAELSTGTITLSSLGKFISNYSMSGPFVNLNVKFS